MTSLVGTQVIGFHKRRGLIWEVGDYVHDEGSWKLILRADGQVVTLPVQDCAPFTPGSIMTLANQLDASGLQAGDRVFVKCEGGHRRGTVVEGNGNKITILYDKCEDEYGGKEILTPIESVLFNISAAIQESNSSSYGPLFQERDHIVTDQEYDDAAGTTIGVYRSPAVITSMIYEFAKYFDSDPVQERVNGQVRQKSESLRELSSHTCILLIRVKST